ncbi:MAG: 4-alpha-glucanotransferase [Muribaculaceae bacterium]|nr:4-alpha-glucanotransferase [Muribaculaceae bacterium]
MKLILNIAYRTNWGETVCVVGNHPALGDGDRNKAVTLTLSGNEHWHVAIDMPDTDVDITYTYFIRHDNGDIKAEWGRGNQLSLTKGTDVTVYDRWQDQPYDKPFYSSAFVDCFCRHDRDGKAPSPAVGHTLVSVAAPMVGSGQVLAISGASAQLGNWDPAKAIRMSASNFPLWEASIPSENIVAETEFKFLVLDEATNNVVAWEPGENRTFGITPDAKGAYVLAGMRFINSLKLWKGAGTAIPVFSLRSDKDMGVGDFFDIIDFIDWAVDTKQCVVQLLPINDTTMTGTWTDSYPYNANSTFALHPMYVRLQEVGTIADPKRRKYYDDLAAELNALGEIDYERVNKAKSEYLHEIFAADGAKTLACAEYKAFHERNKHWLMPYAAFCALRDKFGTPDFNKWGEYAIYTPEVLAKAVKENLAAVDYACFVQYHLDRQMRKVHSYANSRGVALKGDVPIGISRTSADAWTDTRLFNMDCQAGAPPDDFSVFGQNWGFPTYNWEVMSEDGFAWWKARFRKMAEYFDAYRIDHVLGFFRIWQIPMDAVHGLLGYFNPALPFSIDELRYNYDFWLYGSRHTTPFIRDYFLGDFFGPYTDEVRRKFLVNEGGGSFSLKDEFNTQRKVVDYFDTLPKDEKNTRICNGLLGLIDEVLFIEDPVEKGKYHPRITAQYTYSYRAMNDYERWCYDRLYNDFFYHRHNDFWYGKAMWKMPPLIDATDMLVCAEDLGMIPACVPAVMHQLQILSLEIQRMPKDPNAKFGNTNTYPYYSVCTTSTHDMGGIRQWWEEDHAASQRFFNEVLHEGGAAPYFAEPWVCEKIIDLHLQSPSMLCILPLQDWLSMDGDIRRKDPREEQINVPANSRHYWRYRMHLTIDKLRSLKDFNDALAHKIDQFGR